MRVVGNNRSQNKRKSPAGGKREGSSIQFTPLAIKSEILRLSTSRSPIHDYRQPEFYPRIGVASTSPRGTVVLNKHPESVSRDQVVHLRAGVWIYVYYKDEALRVKEFHTRV